MPLTRYIAIVDTTTPPATPDTTPLQTAVSLGDVVINQIHLRIPPGHAGLTGWQLQLSGNTFIPWGQSDGWIIGNDEYADFVINEENTTGLLIVTYNTGIYPHTHYVKIDYTPIAVATPQAPIVQALIL